MEKKQNVKAHSSFLIVLTLVFGFQISSAIGQSSAKLPDFLITTYTGVLSSASSRTKINTNGTCTIKARGYRAYVLSFSDGIPPISQVKFMKTEDTYTATIIYKGKTLAVTVDEEGDLSIGATAAGAFAFSGSIEGAISDERDAINTTVETEDAGIHITNGTISLGTGNTGIRVENGNVSLGTENNSIEVQDGNVSLGTNSTGVSVNTNTRNMNTHTSVCILNHNHSYGAIFGCNSSEISNLPEKIVGIYRGKLSTYDGIENRKGICTIIETGCKTYRLDFSDGIPSIHDIQFGRKNNFDEYTSVIIEGEYSSAIEVDMSFDDLEIDGEMTRVSFDGKRN